MHLKCNKLQYFSIRKSVEQCLQVFWWKSKVVRKSWWATFKSLGMYVHYLYLVKKSQKSWEWSRSKVKVSMQSCYLALAAASFQALPVQYSVTQSLSQSQCLGKGCAVAATHTAVVAAARTPPRHLPHSCLKGWKEGQVMDFLGFSIAFYSVTKSKRVAYEAVRSSLNGLSFGFTWTS